MAPPDQRSAMRTLVKTRAKFYSVETPESSLDHAGALVVHDAVGGALHVVYRVVDAADGVVEGVLDVVLGVPLPDSLRSV